MGYFVAEHWRTFVGISSYSLTKKQLLPQLKVLLLNIKEIDLTVSEFQNQPFLKHFSEHSFLLLRIEEILLSQLEVSVVLPYKYFEFFKVIVFVALLLTGCRLAKWRFSKHLLSF